VPTNQIISELSTFYDKDYHFNDGHVLGSMCTRPLPIAIKAHLKFIEANLGNAGLYPGTQKLEWQVVRSLNSLLHNSKGCGRIVGGGTEANITALWIAKKYWKKNEVIVPRSKHFSVCKAIDLLNLEAKVVDLDDQYRMQADMVEDLISDKTAAVLGIAGTTELGAIDPIEKLSEICAGKTTLHVDASFGGYVIPFLKMLGHDVPEFDFKLPGVTTLAVDPHKMGCATQPSGALLFRSKEHQEQISIDAPYLTLSKQTTLSGTRNSASVAGTWAVMQQMGTEGYMKLVKRCMDNTYYLQKRFEDLGLFPVIKPVMNLLAIRLKHPKRMEEELSKKGWQVSKARNPCSLRFVLMPHVKKKHIDEFMPVFKRVAKKFKEI